MVAGMLAPGSREVIGKPSFGNFFSLAYVMSPTKSNALGACAKRRGECHP
jgi:hypothetical protein